MKRILLLMATQDPEVVANRDWIGVRDTVPGLIDADCVLEMATFGELAYLVDGKESKIWHPHKGWDVADFDLVVFRRVGTDVERATSIAYYLEAKRVPFVDRYLLAPGKGKLSGGFMRVGHALPVPKTFFGSYAAYKMAFAHDAPLTFPLVLKADNGRKGRDNYLIHSKAELFSTLQANPTLELIAQEFIPNDGDMRVLVFNGRIKLVILRKGQEGSHLNNTSQGGSATLLPVSSLDRKMQEDCVRAAQLDQLQVAGVDLVINRVQGTHYFLEVNRAPQLATGAFSKEKLKAYSEMIAGLAAGRAHIN